MRFILSYVFLLLISTLSFQLKDVPLTFLIRPIYWWWTPSASVVWETLPILKDKFDREYSWLAVFSFSILNILCHSLLTCKMSAKKSAYRPMGFPLYITSCFSLAVFKILSLSLTIMISLCVGLFELSLELSGIPGPRCLVSFPRLEKLFL